MDEVLVVKAIEPNYNTLSGGPPIMMVGGRGRRENEDRPVGRTLRERAGGLGGGLVGVLGALAGRHRSLGGLAQSMVSGGAQGASLGRGLGRRFVGRAGQERANIREGKRRAQARADAGLAEDVRSRGQGMGSRLNPFAAVRRRNTAVEEAEQQQLDRTNLANRSMRDAQRQAGDYVAERVAVARNQAEREAQAEQRARAARRGTEFGEQDIEDAEMMRNMREFAQAAYGTTREDFNERMNAAFQGNRRQGGGSVRVDPTQGGTVAVRADGSPIGPSMVAVQNTMGLPAPAGGAGTEINDIENAGNQEAIKEGTDHTGNYGGRLALPAPREDKEEEEDEMSPSTVGVVDSVRPATLADIQRRQREQGGN